MSKFLNELVKNKDMKNKKKIENLISLIVILIVTIIIINIILKDNKTNDNNINENESKYKILSDNLSEENTSDNLEKNLENILSTIKGVGAVKVFINYQESSSIIPLYDETTTVSTTEEEDSSGGVRNITETETQKEVVFSEKSNEKSPITQKNVMPVVQGAIVTAQGAGDATIKTNIINAVQAATGLTINQIQVFEKN